MRRAYFVSKNQQTTIMLAYFYWNAPLLRSRSPPRTIRRPASLKKLRTPTTLPKILGSDLEHRRFTILIGYATYATYENGLALSFETYLRVANLLGFLSASR